MMHSKKNYEMTNRNFEEQNNILKDDLASSQNLKQALEMIYMDQNGGTLQFSNPNITHLLNQSREVINKQRSHENQLTPFQQHQQPTSFYNSKNVQESEDIEKSNKQQETAQRSEVSQYAIKHFNNKYISIKSNILKKREKLANDIYKEYKQQKSLQNDKKLRRPERLDHNNFQQTDYFERVEHSSTIGSQNVNMGGMWTSRMPSQASIVKNKIYESDGLENGIYTFKKKVDSTSSGLNKQQSFQMARSGTSNVLQIMKDKKVIKSMRRTTSTEFLTPQYFTSKFGNPTQKFQLLPSIITPYENDLTHIIEPTLQSGTNKFASTQSTLNQNSKRQKAQSVLSKQSTAREQIQQVGNIIQNCGEFFEDYKHLSIDKLRKVKNQMKSLDKQIKTAQIINKSLTKSPKKGSIKLL